MVRSADAAAREAKIAELKRLITSERYESLEKLEDAVDAFLWADEQETHPGEAVQGASPARSS